MPTASHSAVENSSSWIGYHARRTPSRTAIVDDASGRRFTYAEFDSRADALASHLYAGGIRAGDRVAVLSLNSPHVFEVLEACARIRAVLVPLNWRLQPEELIRVLSDSTPSMFIHDDSNLAKVDSVLDGAHIERTLGWRNDGSPSSYENAVSSPPAEPFDLVPGTDEDPLVIIYTSGTTGLPKGVVHSHRSFRANVDASALAGEISSESVCVTILPTFHVAGIHLFASPVLFHGGTVIVIRQFDPARVLSLLLNPDTRTTHICGVPANYQFMASLPEFADAQFDGLVVAVGGSPVPSVLTEEWTEHGARSMVVFGITEGGSTVASSKPGDRLSAAAAVGIPVIGLSARVVDDAGVSVPAGEIGELLLAGRVLSSGYWNNPAATSESRTPDGWFRTGDAARLDEDGVVHIVDRWKDMYISGGENVYPAEVENALYSHPAVEQVAVVGRLHDKWGETGVAFVVLKAAADCTADELDAWCRSRLAAFKVPSEIRFLQELPRNATGKVVKADIRVIANVTESASI